MPLTVTMNKTPGKRVFYRTRSRLFTNPFGPWNTVELSPTAPGSFYMRSLSHKGPPYRSGGPWFMQRLRWNPGQTRLRGQFSQFSGSTFVTEVQYDGLPTLQYFFPSSSPSFDRNALRGSEDDASQYGATGYNLAKPGKPIFGLPQAIAELKDFPSLFHLRLKKFSDLGSGYLNLEFGWKPFLNDLKNGVKAVIDLDKAIRQIRRDNGKPIRRRAIVTRQFDTWSQKDVDPPILCADGQVVKIVPKSGATTLSWYRQAWFEGMFQYWIPNIDAPGSDLRIAQRLLGLSVDAAPSLIWELLPYSWLVDWLTNIGDVLENMSVGAADNLVCRYGYVMLTDIYAGESSGSITVRRDGKQDTVPLTASYENTYKIRIPCNPFGFSVDWNDFSLHQAAIVAALGLSRLK